MLGSGVRHGADGSPDVERSPHVVTPAQRPPASGSSTNSTSSNRFSWRRLGKRQAQTIATTIERMPPITTAGTAPIAAAATPDSKAPSSFESR